MTYSIRKFARILGCSLLAACQFGCNDGSSSSGNSSQTTSSASALPAATALTSSNGNLDAYVGTWVSDCGLMVSIGSVGQTKSAYNVYKLAKTSSTLLSGTLEQHQFSDSQCSVSASVAGLPSASELVTIKYLAKTTLATPTSASNNFSGSADKVQYSRKAYAGAAASTSTQYMALEGSNRMIMTPALPFSAIDITYAKH